MIECQSCTAPATANLCRTCVGRVVTDLKELAYGFTARYDRCQGLLGDLQDIVLRRTALGGEGGRGGSVHRLPVNLAAADLAWAAEHTLTVWARSVASHNTHLRPSWIGPAAAAEWMASHPGLLADLPDAGEMLDEIVDLHDKVRRYVDRKASRALMGRCNNPADEGGECGTYLYGRATDDGQPDLTQRVVACPECGTGYDTVRMRAWMMDNVRSVRATAHEIATLVGAWYGQPLNVKTIRTWANRGKIRVEDYTQDGTPRHLVGVVLDYALARKQEQHRVAS